MLNKQYDNDTILNNQLGNAYMLNEHHINHLGNAYILNDQEINVYVNPSAVYLASDLYFIAKTTIDVSVAPLPSMASYARRSTQWSIYTNATDIVDTVCDIALNTTQHLHSLRLLAQIYLKMILTMSDVISCHYSNTASITEKCHLIKLKLSQNMLRRHDFKLLMQSMRTKTPTANGMALLIVSIVLHCQAWNIVQHPFRITCKMIRITTAMAIGLKLFRLSVVLYIRKITGSFFSSYNPFSRGIRPIRSKRALRLGQFFKPGPVPGKEFYALKKLYNLF